LKEAPNTCFEECSDTPGIQNSLMHAIDMGDNVIPLIMILEYILYDTKPVMNTRNY
jgi:hypothetical protein